MSWMPIETAPHDPDRPILGLCRHDADPFFADESETKLTLYAAHVEGLSHVEDGPNVLVWGGAWKDSQEDGGGHMPDWWFLHGSEFEIAANPTHWMEIPNPDQVGPPWSSAPAPTDGRFIVVREERIYRYLHYKPTSEQRRKRGQLGRWQRMNEYGGWENCPPPTDMEWYFMITTKGGRPL